MADLTPYLTSDSAGFLTVHWDASHGQETMVAREVLVQMVDDINRLRAEVARLGAFLHPIGEKARRG